MSMNAYSQIVNSLRQISKAPIDEATGEILTGEVMTIKPLSIKINNNDRQILPANFFVISSALKELSVKIKLPQGQGILIEIADREYAIDSDATERQIEVQLLKPLEVGDRVILLSFNKGQKYFVAERL